MMNKPAINGFYFLILYQLFFFFFACNSDSDQPKSYSSPDTNRLAFSKSINSSPNKNEIIKSERKTFDDRLHSNSLKQADEKNKSKSSIEIKIFQNSDINGYGYDIIIDGKPYVHQPTIPALSGNRGFETSDQAFRVALLMKAKILNHNLPPSINSYELDSLGIK